MASYRPFHPPPHSSFAPPPPSNQNSLPPPPAVAPRPQRGGSQYSQNWGPYSGGDGSNYNFQLPGYGSSSSQQHFNPPAPQQQPFQFPPPPPPPPPESSSYPPPPPPPQSAPAAAMYYPSSQYSQFNQPPPPPAPPSSPPPPPPPLQLSSPPPLPSSAPLSAGPSRESRQPNPAASSRKEQKPPLSNKRPGGRIETEEERRLRKKREFEKHKKEENHKQHLRESQNKVLQKTQMLASGAKGHGSISGSHMGDRRSTPLLGGDRIENRLKKPTTFLCKLKFRNELPDPSAKMKLLSLKRDPDRYCKYQITSLEKNWKPQLHVEPDLGIPLDLLDLSVYNPPKGEQIPLDPEDEDLLRDDDPITPSKTDGIKKKERPTDKGVSWLVKTQYISPLSIESTKQSLTEKQAKELREYRGRSLLENLNSRDRKIQDIVASFEACKTKPVHAVNRHLQPRRILPLLPDFNRYEDHFVVATFDSAPTVDSEIYRKLTAADRDEYEQKAVMRSYGSTSTDSERPNGFLAYMVPSVDEIEKDIYDETEDVSYSWVREYHCDVRGDDVDDPTTYLVSFGDTEARYLPLPKKLILRKKRAREGKSTEDVQQFPVPRSVTVRRRTNVSIKDLTEEEDFVPLKGNLNSRSGRGASMDRGPSRLRRMSSQDMEPDDYSGAEDDLSE
ncbi:Protein PAF1 [Salvia divinorum]|uniref:Protein PAF1 n=1 Tax=Salvia divinorum TaxID=28513 RepID=A0ABD1FNL4_SALDI